MSRPTTVTPWSVGPQLLPEGLSAWQQLWGGLHEQLERAFRAETLRPRALLHVAHPDGDAWASVRPQAASLAGELPQLISDGGFKLELVGRPPAAELDLDQPVGVFVGAVPDRGMEDAGDELVRIGVRRVGKGWEPQAVVRSDAGLVKAVRADWLMARAAQLYLDMPGASEIERVTAHPVSAGWRITLAISAFVEGDEPQGELARRLDLHLGGDPAVFVQIQSA